MNLDSGALYIALIFSFTLSALTSAGIITVYREMQEMNIKYFSLVRAHERRINDLEIAGRGLSEE